MWCPRWKKRHKINPCQATHAIMSVKIAHMSQPSLIYQTTPKQKLLAAPFTQALRYHNMYSNNGTYTHNHFTATIQVKFQHPRLKTGGVCWRQVLLSTGRCWKQLVHLNCGDATVLLNRVSYIHIRLTALCPGLPRWASTRKVKTNLDFTEARDSEWQWHQLGRMQVCTSLQTDNHASTPPLRFLQAGCPSCHPTNSVKALKAVCPTCLQQFPQCPSIDYNIK